MGRNDKRKYQRNCGFSFKRKMTAWNKRKDMTQILPKVTKAPFIIRKNG